MITVVRAAQQPVTNGAITTYSFQLTAEDPVNMPAEIFRIRQSPLDNTVSPPTQNNYFDGVCTPYDLANLPINEPTPPNDTYRLAQVTITYTNEYDGEQGWINIQANIQLLINSLIAQSLLQVEESVTFS